MGAEIILLHSTWTSHLPGYTLQDTLGTLVAVLVFVAVLYAPGYLAAHTVDLFGFREKSFAERSLWAIVISFSTAPLAAYLLGRLVGLHGLLWFFSLCTAGTAALLPTAKHRGWPPRDRRATALLAGGWTLATLLLLVDLQIGHRLYYSVVMADQSYRIAFTAAVARTGIPPANPLYFAGHPAPMPYFYFWYVLCAVVMELAHVTARQAFIASSVWAGFGLLTAVHLYTRHFFNWEPRRRWLALALLAVNGADLIPAIGQAALQPTLNGNTEWWSVDPIFAWPDSLLWVPHHVASVLCCLVALLLLWRTREPLLKPADRRWAVVLSAVASASAFGLSVYVATGFGLLVCAWWCWLLLKLPQERMHFNKRLPLAASLSVVLLLPFFREIRTNAAQSILQRAGAQAAPLMLSLSIRRMIDSELLTGLPALRPLMKSHPVLLDQAIRLLLLAPGLAMELGVYGVVLVFLMLPRNRRISSHSEDVARRTALFLSIAGLVMTLFLTSSVITNNDFGYRAVMLPQFFLLLLAADLIGSAGRTLTLPSTVRRLVYSLMAIGVAGTAYWAFLLRAWLPMEAVRPNSGFAQSPEDEFEFRQAFDDLNRSAPAQAVLAFRAIDPVADRQGAVMLPNEYYQRMLVMNSDHQLLNAEGKCATHFGGDPRPCRAIQDATARIYALPAPDAAAARDFCRRFGVQYLLLSAWDPGWQTTTGWPADLPVTTKEPRMRILQCN